MQLALGFTNRTVSRASADGLLQQGPADLQLGFEMRLVDGICASGNLAQVQTQLLPQQVFRHPI